MNALGILHVLCGKAGAGKTTLARRLALEMGGVFICEDEWLAKLADPIRTLDDYVKSAARIRSVVEPLAGRLLALGVPVVFDFAGNTVRHRQWARGIASGAGTEAVLHVIEASDELCKARIRERNATKPEGIYWGDVSEEMFDAVTRHFAPPGEDEGFRLVHHRAG